MGIIFETVLLWLMWAFIFIGIGAAVFSLAGLTAEDFFDCFWVGWASSLFFLQIGHFFSPINTHAFLVCSLISLVGWIGSRGCLLRFDRNGSWGGMYLFLLFSTIVAVWLALQLWSSLILYDHPLYYLQQIFWAKTFPIIPGLANLYNRLGFYDGFFLYTAMMDSLPPIPGYKLSVSLLMFVLLVRSIWGVVRVIKDQAASGLRNIFFAVLFVPVFIKAGTPCTVNVPVTDTAVFILTIIVFGYFLDFLACHVQKGGSSRYIFLITVLSTAGMIIKGSFLFVGAWVLLMTYILWILKSDRSPVERRIVITGIFIAGAAGCFPFIIRNIIVSGYPFYPFPYLSVPVDWRVPFAKSYATFNWILSWSRAPYLDWKIVLKDSAWFFPWLRFMMNQWMDIELPGIIFILASAVLIGRVFLSRIFPSELKIWGIFSGTAGMCLLTWFLSTPDIRFMGAQLLVLAAGATTILLLTLRSGPKLFWWTGGVLIGTFIAARVTPVGLAVLATQYLSDSNHFYQSKKVGLKLFKTGSGLVVYTPAKGEFCWDVSVLCTPYPDAQLMLRKPNDIFDGFKIATHQV